MKKKIQERKYACTVLRGKFDTKTMQQFALMTEKHTFGLDISNMILQRI